LYGTVGNYDTNGKKEEIAVIFKGKMACDYFYLTCIHQTCQPTWSTDFAIFLFFGKFAKIIANQIQIP